MLGVFRSAVPYCGAPPFPGHLWARWNLDPILIGLLLLALAAYVVGSGRPAARLSTTRRLTFVAGWSVATLALISPLCPLSVALFSARVGQHMILSLVAAPLVLLGRPAVALRTLWPAAAAALSGRSWVRILTAPPAAIGLFTLAMWFWHAPGPYDLTFISPLVYWLMHLSVFGSALLVWNIVLAPARLAPALATASASGLQMTFLGALITLTPHMLYSPHVLTPYVWGLTQASDQQLGGLIMWVPACIAFITASLVTLGRAMGEPRRAEALA